MDNNDHVAEAVLIYHLPITRRCTLASFLYALSRATVFIITSFDLIYLTSYFDPFGLWFITLPVASAYFYGILYFEDLERKTGMFEQDNPQYTTQGNSQSASRAS